MGFFVCGINGNFGNNEKKILDLILIVLFPFMLGGIDSESVADINFDSEVDIFDLLLLFDFI